MSLMGNTKLQVSSHGAESTAPGYDERNLPSSGANSPNLPVAKPFRSPHSSASSRAPKRIKRHQDSRTPTTCATKDLKANTTSNEHWRSTRYGRVPLADLGSTQRPSLLTPRNQKYQEHPTPKTDRAREFLTEIGEAPQKSDSDEESFGGGDIFTSTDQQKLSTLHKEMPRHSYDDETTTEF